MLYDKKTCLSGNPPPIKSNAEMLELKEFYQVRSILASVDEIERRVKERKEIILYVCGGCIYMCASTKEARSQVSSTVVLYFIN